MLDDLTNATADAKLALAVERHYRTLVAGTLRTKRLPPERLALIFASIAEDLIDRASVSH